MKIGIMGGTFDPIHMGHLITAEMVLDSFSIDEILFIPSANPPHKQGKEIAPAKSRLEMAILATGSNPRFSVSDLELRRKEPSYALVTVEELQRKYGENTLLYFILGADAAMELATWYHARELIST